MTTTRRKKRASLNDVATRAGVSVTTVSRVLNGLDLAAPETRDRILNAAKELDYVVDPRFRAMAKAKGNQTTRTGNIGALIRYCSPAQFASHPFYSRLFWGIQSAAESYDCHVILSMFEDNPSPAVPELVSSNKVDGVLILGQCLPEEIERLHRILPIVLVNTVSVNLPVPSVMPDELQGMVQAVDHLRKLGHRHIWYFDIHDERDSGGRVNVHHWERSQAFARCMTEPGSENLRSVILSARAKSLPETVSDLLAEWKNEGQWPTALICGSDVYATAFMDAATALGISIPGDLSIIGSDNTVACDYTRPPLSSIAQPFDTMGRAGLDLLMTQLSHDQAGPNSLRFGTELVLRSSTAAAPTR